MCEDDELQPEPDEDAPARPRLGDETDRLQQLFTTARSAALHHELGEPVPRAKAGTLLCHLPMLRDTLSSIEVSLTEAVLDAGGTWDDVAEATDRGSRQGAQRRYRRLGGDRTWPTRRPEPAHDTQPTTSSVRDVSQHHAVTIDLHANEETYFVLTEALRDFAHQQRSQAEHEDDEPTARTRSAEEADALLQRIEAAL